MTKKDFEELKYALFATKGKRFAVNVAFCLLMFSLCFLILQPFFNKISLSLMSPSDLADSTVISVPKLPTLENFKMAWELLKYEISMPYTAVLSLITGLLQTASSFLVGYGFARYKFPLKKFWFACVILMIVLPVQSYSISLFLNFRFFDVLGIFRATTGAPLNLIGTPIPQFLMAMTATGLKNGLYIYLFYQHFRGVPKDLEEAAYLDGCGTVRTLFQVMLPDAIPLVVSCMLFAFVWQWTDHQFTNLLLSSDHYLATLLLKVGSMVGTSGGNMAGLGVSTGMYADCLTATATLLMLIPVVTIYLIGQRKFVESLSFSGVKM